MRALWASLVNREEELENPLFSFPTHETGLMPEDWHEKLGQYMYQYRYIEELDRLRW